MVHGYAPCNPRIRPHCEVSISMIEESTSGPQALENVLADEVPGWIGEALLFP